jgi:ribosome biogenesis GTPase
VRVSDGRGRHTTTRRELLVLPSGGLIIDTPGMRELQLLLSERGMRETFEDIERAESLCRFADCGHENEPGCAVRDALASGEIEAERYGNYRKMQREMEAGSAPSDARLARERKMQVKRITRTFNKTPKRRGGDG